MDRATSGERDQRPDTGAPGAQELAGTLDRLSLDEADRVLRRAIELSDSQVADRQDALDRGVLERVARELGIDQSALAKAMAEESLRTTGPQGFLDRVLGPLRVTTQRSVPTSPEETRHILDEWMARHEGLRVRRRNSNGVTWERDEQLVTKIRVGLRLGQGSRSVRDASSITDSVAAISATESLLALDADLTRQRHIAAALGAGAIAAATAAGVGAGVLAGGDGGFNTVGAVAAGGTSLAVLGGGVWIGIRMWVDRIRAGLERAADAIAHPTFLDETDTVPDKIRRIFGNWRNLRDDIKRL